MARAAVIPKASPPKRATRTTAKRPATTSTTTATSKTTKTAPSKPATRTTTKGKAPTSATEARKRGVRTAAAASKQTDDSSDDGTDDELGDIDTKPKTSTMRGKAKQTTSTTATAGRGRRTAAAATPEVESDEDEDELAQTEAPKKRAGRPKAKPVEPATKPPPAPKTRGRPKGSGTSKTSAASSTAGQENTQRKTRAQASVEPEPEVEQAPREIIITTNSTSMRSNILRGPAKKKKVTFRDPDSEEDMSEPIPPPAGRRRGATPAKKAGLGAKPVRSSPAASGRGRKPAAAKKGVSKPLSPKKATQVAKSISSYASSDGEDDELSVAKSPVRITVASPTKHGSTNTGLSSPVKRINFAPVSPHRKVDENGEPTTHFPMPMDFSESLFMSSPARRPTPSPFNFTMRETPRRGGFTLREDMKPLSQPEATPTKSSPLKASPKKANLETPRRGNLSFLDESKPLSQPNFTPGHNSPLKSSPKKGLFSISLPSQPAPPVSSTPLKSMSLLQSPAKKIASPFKSSIMKHSPLVEDDHLDDEDQEDSHTPSQNPPKPVNFDDLEDDMETEDDEHADAATADECEDTEYEMRAQAVSNRYARETEESENSDDELGEQPQEYISNYIDYHPSAAGDDVFEEPMNPLDLQVEEAATDGSREPADDKLDGENVETEANGDELEDGEQDADSHTEDHPEETHQMDLEDYQQKRETFAHDPVENINDENVHVVEEHVPDVEEDHDHGETPEQAQDSAENKPEHQTARDESISSARHSLVQGLEDVFIDTALETNENEMDEDHVSTNGDEMSEADGQEDDDMAGIHNHYDEGSYDIGDDYAFDDDEDTLVAFELTGQQQMFNALDIVNEQSQDNTPHQVEHEPPQSPIESTEEQIVQAPINDYEEEPQENAAQEAASHSSPVPSIPNAENYRDHSKDETDSNTDEMSDSEPVAEERIQANKNSSPQGQPEPEHQSPAPATEASRGNRPRFTLLADQLSGWKASSPQKPEPRRSKRRGVFSLGGALRSSSGVSSASRLSGQVSYPEITTHEDGEAPEPSHGESNPEVQDITTNGDMMHESEVIQDNVPEVQSSIEQRNFEIFSDPDAEVNETEPVEQDISYDSAPAPSIEDHGPMKPESPAQEASFEDDDNKENDDIPLFGPVTPVKNKKNQLQTFHTVSKVPLKGEGQISPLKVPRKRGLSLSGTSPTRSSSRIRKSLGPLEPASLRPPRKLPRLSQEAIPKLQPDMSRRRSSMNQQPRSVKKPSRSSSPTKSSRKSLSAASNILRGAVVFVDVHTTEGEDASGIFIELLQQMGARCVKNWSWNPRASVSPDEETQTKEGRVGITHVVYKDGGVRTLEKVRHARGLVKCVGVGWVLDCEREGKWLDEAHYTVDSSIIPRGGGKRRKSMEPRALSNVNGTLVTSNTAKRSGADWNTVEEFRRHTPTPPLEEPSTPTNNRKYDADINERYFQTPKTPGIGFNIDNIGMSPATPAYLSQRNRLVQQTCPPKQLQQGLFSKAGPSEEPSQKLRAKLEAARRKSLAYKPKVGSRLIE